MIRIPHIRPFYGDKEREYVQAALGDANFLETLEQAICARTGALRCVPTSSGTLALHLGLVLSGVGPGDEVLVPSLTYIATALAIRRCGAIPVFFDVEPETWHLDPNQVEDYLKWECEVHGNTVRHHGRPVRGILLVHLYGHAQVLAPFRDMQHRWPIQIFEDACEALGVEIHNENEAAGTMGRFGALSFNLNKIVTTQGGGAILTNEKTLARRAGHLIRNARVGEHVPTYYETGLGDPLSNIQAAIGVAQLERLDEVIRRKRQIQMRYRELLPDLNWLMPPRGGSSTAVSSTFWQPVATFDLNGRQKYADASQVVQFMQARGIDARMLWTPLHSQPVFRAFAGKSIVEADRIHRWGISFPCSVEITDQEQQEVADVFRSAFR